MEEIKTAEITERMPMIGDPAPEFRAMTTMGKIDRPGSSEA